MTKASVLLVDDEPQVLVALDDLLCDDFTVFKTESAEQALLLARAHQELAVVVTDQRMPRLTGDELVANLCGCSDAERILLTGFADLSAVVRAVNDGHIFAYVTKPWNPADLLMKVHKAVEHFRMSKALAEEQRLLRDLMDSVPDGIYFKDADLRFSRVNRAHASLLNGGESAHIVGKHLRDLVPDRQDVLDIEAEERRVLAGSPALDVIRAEGQNGSQRWFSESKAPILGAKGATIGLVGISRDITDRKLQQERIARLTRIQAVTSGINAAIVRQRERAPLLDECCRIAVEVGELGLALALSWNAQAERLEILSAAPADCPLVTDLKRLLAASDAGSVAALRALVESSTPRLAEDAFSAGFPAAHAGHALATFPLAAAGEQATAICLFSQLQSFDEQEFGLLGEVTDNIAFGLQHITKTQRLDFLAYHDELTRLPNRSLFLERLNQRLPSCRSDGSKAAVLVVDIGRFRQINETLGRSAGDRLLIQLAERISASVRELDTVARFDSNTFAVLAAPLADASEVVRLAETAVLPALKDSFRVDGTELRVAAKLGISLFPGDGDTAEALVASAEVALKTAKQGLASYLFYASSMQEQVAERLMLETKLRRAVDAREFELHYQPKVELRTGLIVGLEALMRWRDPELGPVSPVQFIPMLEETCLIREVGRWAIEEAEAQFSRWLEAGLRPPRIAVNVSAIQLAAQDLMETLNRPGVGESIDLEITESVFVKDLAGSVSKLEGARALGLKVSIDDFGTGYSSLGYLSRLPIDALKIDRSFIVNMATDPQETTIVNAIISLAHSMDLKVIAEGVETADQARLLRLLKCDQIQGYLVSRAQPAAEVAKLLGNRFNFSTLREPSPGIA
jgi:diguanylate cyclase (GGDEF)-like protein/PAS domain S-box-containing protein